MNIHNNARLTPSGRALLVHRYLDGESAAEVAEPMGVSPPTVNKWVRRWRAQGGERLPGPLLAAAPEPEPAASAPAAPDRAAAAEAMEHTPDCPGAEDAALHGGPGVPATGAGTAPDSEPAEAGDPLRAGPAGGAASPGHEEAGMHRGGRHRIHGERSRTVEAGGWEFLHVCIDDATRVAYAEMLPDERGKTAAAFLRRAVRWFEPRGGPPSE